MTRPNERGVIEAAAEARDPRADWARQIFHTLKAAHIRQVCHVPDGGHARLIELCAADPELMTTTLTTEEEGVALACGAWLGGDRSVLLMQSNGVGNCINMLSMVRTCAFPFLAIVSMRGQWGEFVPWQIPMAQATPAVLSAMGVIVQPVDRPADVAETVASGTKLAFDGGAAVAMLLNQRLIGAKEFQQ